MVAWSLASDAGCGSGGGGQADAPAADHGAVAVVNEVAGEPGTVEDVPAVADLPVESIVGDEGSDATGVPDVPVPPEVDDAAMPVDGTDPGEDLDTPAAVCQCSTYDDCLFRAVSSLTCRRWTCDPATCQCVQVNVDDGAECDDGNACNGVETCDPYLGCVSGGTPWTGARPRLPSTTPCPRATPSA